MKTHIVLLLSFVALMLSSCSDDEGKKQKIEKPLNAYLKTVDEAVVQEQTGNSTNSLGYQFKTKKAGSIIALGLSAPQAGTYKVSLYDATTDKLLSTTQVTLTDEQVTTEPHGFQYTALTIPVQVDADQLLKVAYDTNTSSEKFYAFEVESIIFQLEGSFIEFQSGVFGDAGKAPDKFSEIFYTADVQFKHK